MDEMAALHNARTRFVKSQKKMAPKKKAPAAAPPPLKRSNSSIAKELKVRVPYVSASLQ